MTTLDLETLEKARKTVAKAIALHGEAYLPIFMRLDREVESRKQKDNAMQRALDLAKSITD